MVGALAAADLTAVTGGRFLTMGATGLDLTPAGGRIDVVLEADTAPDIGQAVSQMGPGATAKVEASAAIAQGVRIGSAANGQARLAQSGDVIAGISMNAVGAQGEVVSVYLNFPGIAP